MENFVNVQKRWRENFIIFLNFNFNFIYIQTFYLYSF